MFCILQYLEVKQILLLTIACLCHKGIHMPSLCAFYGNMLRRILPDKRPCSRQAHSESAVNTPLVTEQMTESVHTTSLWQLNKWLSQYIPPACGRLEMVSPENHFLFINSYTHIQVCVCVCVCVSYTIRQMYIQMCLFCFMPHWFCHERAHWCICRFNIDII